MTTYYAGVGGNDANNGTSYALRKLTIQGAVNLATTAGDQVLVSPGTYRETVTLAASGSGGSPISLIGDYTGANTSGVRGVVRITGSNDDITATRTYCVTGTSKNYVTVCGFAFDLATTASALFSGCTNIILERCTSQYDVVAGYFVGACTSCTVRNCDFRGASQYNVMFADFATARDNCANVIESSILQSGTIACVYVLRHGGVTVRNCTITNALRGVYALTLTGGQTTNVNNCIITGHTYGLQASASGEITEDYNTIWGVTTARTNVSTGANSVTRPPLFDTRWFFEAVNSGKVATPFDLASYSTLVEYNSGTGAPSTDMRGAAVTGTYREWGALEYNAALAISGGGGAPPLLNFGSGMQVG